MSGFLFCFISPVSLDFEQDKRRSRKARVKVSRIRDKKPAKMLKRHPFKREPNFIRRTSQGKSRSDSSTSYFVEVLSVT
jgi:hypothetical protein